MNQNNSSTILLKQIFRFGLIGGLAFFIDAGTLFFCTHYLHIYYLVSSIISFCISVIFNYIASIKYVFKPKAEGITAYTFAIFVGLSIAGLFLTELFMYIGTECLHYYYMFTKIISTFLVMIFNFITRKIIFEEEK